METAQTAPGTERASRPKNPIRRAAEAAAAAVQLSRALIGRGWLEIRYWFRLFVYTSRQHLRLEAGLAALGAVLFYGALLTQSLTLDPRTMLEHSYIFFSAVTVILCMNVLPRERDQGTLEILWSQPIRRGRLVLLQLLTLTFWIAVLAAVCAAALSYLTVYSKGYGLFVLCLSTTAFSAGALTILISTFTRHAIATGLVSLLVLGMHYFWIRQIGPIQFYYNPIPPAGLQEAEIPAFDLWFNRGMVIVTAGFVLDYLFRRLRRTAEWFT